MRKEIGISRLLTGLFLGKSPVKSLEIPIPIMFIMPLGDLAYLLNFYVENITR